MHVFHHAGEREHRRLSQARLDRLARQHAEQVGLRLQSLHRLAGQVVLRGTAVHPWDRRLVVHLLLEELENALVELHGAGVRVDELRQLLTGVVLDVLDRLLAELVELVELTLRHRTLL